MAQILVIENERLLRRRILDILRYEGFDTVEATDGREGLRLAEILHPDMILCDIEMPGMNGAEVRGELRKNSATADLPVIFLTARWPPDDRVQNVITDRDGYLTKPFTIQTLLAEIHTYLNPLQERSGLLASRNVE